MVKNDINYRHLFSNNSMGKAGNPSNYKRDQRVVKRHKVQQQLANVATKALKANARRVGQSRKKEVSCHM